MEQRSIKSIFIIAVMVVFSGCRAFEKVEITDHYYVMLPNKSVECFSYSVPPEYNGITYSFKDNIDSTEIIMGNHYYHFLVSFCPPDYIKLQHDFGELQHNSDGKERRFSWFGTEVRTKGIGSDSTLTYWGGLLFFKPHFAPHMDWYFIAFQHIPKNKIQLYKKALRLRYHFQPLREQSPWAPLFAPDKMEQIYKTFN